MACQPLNPGALRGPKEVTLCFDSHLFRGNRTRKVKVAEYDAFESPNFPVLGTLGVEAQFEPGLKAKGRPALLEKLDSRVFLLKVFPGLDPAQHYRDHIHLNEVGRPIYTDAFARSLTERSLPVAP